MDELNYFCNLGAPVSFGRNWELKEQAILKLSQCGYIQIAEMEEEPEEEEEEEAEIEGQPEYYEDEEGHMHFVQVMRPADLDLLSEACASGKDLLIESLLWGEKRAQEILECHYYLETSQIRILSEQAGDAGLKYFVQAFSRFPETVLSDFEPATPTTTRDEAADWKRCKCFQLDSSNLQEEEQNKLKIQACSDHSAHVMLKVEPYARIDEFHLALKIHVSFLQVQAQEQNPSSKLKKGGIGPFPDRIKLSLKPNWAEMSVPQFLGGEDLNYGAPVQRETENKIGLGVSKIPLTGKIGRAWRSRWTDYSESLEQYAQKGGAATIEWNLVAWKDGSRYNDQKFFYFFVPELPFRGTGRSFKALPQVLWDLDLDKKSDELAFEITLEFRMQYVDLSGKIVKSSKYVPQDFKSSHKLLIQLPSVMITAPTYLL